MTILHVDHAIGPTGRKRTVRNDHRSYISQKTIESGEDKFFRGLIECGSTFIKNENFWSLQQSSRQCHSLTFSARKPVAARTQRFIPTIRKPVYERLELDQPCHCCEFACCCSRISEKKVLAQCHIEQNRILRHVNYRRA